MLLLQIRIFKMELLSWVIVPAQSTSVTFSDPKCCTVHSLNGFSYLRLLEEIFLTDFNSTGAFAAIIFITATDLLIFKMAPSLLKNVSFTAVLLLLTWHILIKT